MVISNGLFHKLEAEIQIEQIEFPILQLVT